MPVVLFDGGGPEIIAPALPAPAVSANLLVPLLCGQAITAQRLLACP